MTEAEWLAEPEPAMMLAHLQGWSSNRKLRLLACAYARQVWHLLHDERSRQAVITAEQAAEGTANREELKQAESDAREVLRGGTIPIPGMEAALFYTGKSKENGILWYASRCAANVAITEAWHSAGSPEWFAAQMSLEALSNVLFEQAGVFHKSHPQWKEEPRKRKQFLRGFVNDIFGNPFHRVAIEPNWLTPEMVGLAQSIYDDQVFDPLPVLADTLEEAGCDNADILAHCRQPGPHVRGCWALDLMLGKE